MAYYAGLPADAGLDKKITPICSVAENLHMLDISDASNGRRHSVTDQEQIPVRRQFA
jgi:hypothetical protein